MKKNHIYSSICIAMALLMLLFTTACSKDVNEEQGSSNTPGVLEPITVDNPVSYFYMSILESADKNSYIEVSKDQDGNAYIQFVATNRIVTTKDAAVFHNIAKAIEEAKFSNLHGKNTSEEGDARASLYVEFADGSNYSASCSGIISEEFLAAYKAMENFFSELTADVSKPQAEIRGEVNAEALSAMQEIHNAGMEYLDTLFIAEVDKDEYFGFTLGLSNTDGITHGIICSPTTNVTAYSLVIVTLEDESKKDSVAADFEANMDWRKWVCVAPNNALIAYKDNMVLCVMGSNSLFEKTATAIAETGWTEFKTLKNPDM